MAAGRLGALPQLGNAIVLCSHLCHKDWTKSALADHDAPPSAFGVTKNYDFWRQLWLIGFSFHGFQ